MAKNIRKMLALVLVMCMFVSALPMQALAAERGERFSKTQVTRGEFKKVGGRSAAAKIARVAAKNSSAVANASRAAAPAAAEGDKVTTNTETKQEGGLTTTVTTTTTVSNGDSTPTITVEVKESTTTGFTGPGTSINRTENSSTTTVTHKDEQGNVVGEEVVHSKEETHTDTTIVTGNSVTTQHVVDGKESSKGEVPLPEGGVEVDVPLTKGEENSVTFGDPVGKETITGDVQNGENDTEYDYEKSTVVEEGKVTITNKDVTIEETFNNEDTKLEYIKSETNPDGTNDMTLLPEDNGGASEEFLPGYEGETVKPEIPDGYDYVYVGSGNTSKYFPAIAFTTPLSEEDKLAQYGENAYIKKNSITYYYVGWLTEEVKSTIAKDEQGNYVTDAEGYILDVDGNRIFKEERTAVGPNGETVYLHRFDNYNSSLNVEGWYDSETGEWIKELNGSDAYTAVWAGPQQFVLVDAEGNIITTYCADFSTPTQDFYGYNIENLEEADYYTDAEAEMIRSIAKNGYWGTEEGVGSLEAMKEQLLAAGFTAEELESLNDGVALTATQMAIWSQSNKMTGLEFVNAHYSNWGTGNVPEEKEDEVKLLFKIYDYLINLDPTKTQKTTADTIINAENFVKDLSVTVIDMDRNHSNNKDYNTSNDAYTTKVSFSLVVAPSDSGKDSLVAYLMDADGNVMASGRIAGEGDEPELSKDENGNYYFDNVTMVEGDQSFQLKLSGVQYLEEGVYLYSSEISEDDVSSQTMVGLASGERGVNVSMDIQFNLDVQGLSVTERVWHEESDPTESNPPAGNDPGPDSDPGTPINEPVVTVWTAPENQRLANEEAVEIPEEPVPLAAPAITGDDTGVWVMALLMIACCMVAINVFDKKRNHETF